MPDDLADVLLVRLDRLDDAARQVVRAASVAGRKVSHDMLAAASGLAAAALDEGLRKAVEMNVLVAGDGRYSFRHALLGEAVYDDLLPGERVRLHAQYAEALREGRGRGTAAELARHARLADDLDTALDGQHPGRRRGDGGRRPRRGGAPLPAGARAARRPAPRRASVDVDLSKLVVSAAEALTASGDPQRAAALLARAARPAARGRPADAWRARMLAGPGRRADPHRDRRGPGRRSRPRPSPCSPTATSGLRAKVLAIQARVLAGYGPATTRRRSSGWTRSRWPSGSTCTSWSPTSITTLSGLKKAGPKEGLRAALVDAVAPGRASPAPSTPSCAARFLLGRSYEDWAEFDEAETLVPQRHRPRGRARASPGRRTASSPAWQLAWVKMRRRRLGRGAAR